MTEGKLQPRARDTLDSLAFPGLGGTGSGKEMGLVCVQREGWGAGEAKYVLKGERRGSIVAGERD